MLSKTFFSEVVKNTPLISIDLLVYNSEGKVLLGKRVNEPACGFWFVPGGRIFKDESLDDAFARILKEELDIDMERSDALFDKIYEHFYDKNVFNDKFSTHYIVLAHKIQVDCFVLSPYNKGEQHSEYKWFGIDELLKNDNVHKYTKDYFR
ncbi:GDP-mannose mannosyl hydrolase [bacterium]|nr:GDP-mannose mannosyl hydrolase [bacterium]MBU1993797.1 GDP-mannose mannosyl hydrolase [bacterium]